MPIRFRCKYCYQLLGIARRKAGTTVQCPTCRGKLMVPATDAADPAGSGGAPAPAEPEVLAFERSDFDDYLKEPYAEPAERRGGTAASTSQPVAPAFATIPPPGPVIDVEPLAPVVAPAAIVLSPAKATVLVVAVICLLALAFAAGVAVDRWFLQP
jgi:hypothetical protein